MSEWWVIDEWVMSEFCVCDELVRGGWVSDRVSEWLCDELVRRQRARPRWGGGGGAAVGSKWKKDPTQWWWGNCNKNKKTCKCKSHMEWKRMEIRLLFLKQLCHNKGNIFFILFTNRCILVWQLGTLLYRRDRDTGTCCGYQLCIWDTGKVHQRSFRA